MPVTARQAHAAGGLAVGVLSALRRTGGLWFGWSGETRERPAAEPRLVRTGRITYALVDLTPGELEGFYAGFANRVLWPLFHYRIDLATYEHAWFRTYLEVNRRLAAQLAPLLEPDDVVWVHDYHLIPFAAELRQLGVKNRVGFFLHIPFPAAEVYVTMPWHRQLAAGLCAYDVVGFQTATDLRQFHDYVVHELGGQVGGDGTVRVLGRELRTLADPIGIDVRDVRAMAVSPEANRQAHSVANTLAGRSLVLGVDRLDYTKGIPRRLRAYEAMLREHPEMRRRCTFLQISAPSREQVPEYVRLRQEVELLAGHINGTFGEADWVPLRYVNRAYSRRALLGLCRLARAALITPLRDGMNLLALEYITDQRPEDPGVLVRARPGGCAAYLEGVLTVNPYDVHQVAQQLHRALTMPLPERVEMWRRAMAAVERHDVHRWRRTFLEALVGPGADAAFDGDPGAAG